VRRGEGVQSLARAFMYAGARSVVASLWQVDDNETEQTMDGFYRRFLAEGLSPADALRQSRLEVRHTPPSKDRFLGIGRGGLTKGAEVRIPAMSPRELAGHPYFWAPFVYIGPAR
jgi:CHAT domain-containing protein